MDQNLHADATYDHTSRYHEEVNGVQLLQHEEYLKPESKSNMTLGEKSYISGIKQPLLDGARAEEGLKKLDSFNQWVLDGALEDVTESHIQTGSRADWDTVESENCVDDSSQVRMENYVLSPSLSQEQLFSIIDFSPNWAYEDSEVKVRYLLHMLCDKRSYVKCAFNVLS